MIMQAGGPSLRVPGREAICPMFLSRLVLGEPTTGAAFILDLGGGLSADCCQEPDEGAVYASPCPAREVMGAMTLRIRFVNSTPHTCCQEPPVAPAVNHLMLNLK